MQPPPPTAEGILPIRISAKNHLPLIVPTDNMVKARQNRYCIDCKLDPVCNSQGVGCQTHSLFEGLGV
jgi:hypothetical protein